MEQTAVNWLIEKLNQCEPMYSSIASANNKKHIDGLIELAMSIEKRQIIEARVTAPLLSTFDKADYKEEAEQYYTETFGKD